jgi:hypothetical protein
LTEWTDPIVIVGGAQILMAFVLALLTAFPWRSTDKYANLTEADLEVKEQVRHIERLHKELDYIIGPLYSRLGDPIYFNSKTTNWTMWYPNNEKRQPKYRGSEFWRNIRKMLYLTTLDTRKGVEYYLNIKLGIVNIQEDENHPSYQKSLQDITYVVEERYKAIVKELDELDLKLTTKKQ